MHKFCLKWSEFETNIRQSFKQLRTDQTHFDVTLASDDDYQIQAHKIILSAGSQFLNNILGKAKHPNPFIYLKGIKRVELENIVEFLYNGEVSVPQVELNTFLETAQELQVKGLQSFLDFQNIQNLEKKDWDDQIKLAVESKSDIKEELSNPSGNDVEVQLKDDPGVTDTELDSQIQNMLERSEGLWKCRVCAKTFKDRCTIKRHAETHIEGVTHTCHFCNKTSSTRRTLRDHISNVHSGFLYDCEVCDKIGMTKNAITKHNKKHHQQEEH